MYYLIEISTTSENTAKAIWDKNTLDDATIALHQSMAFGMSSENVLQILCMIINSTGAVMRSELWQRPVNTEPVEEQE